MSDEPITDSEITALDRLGWDPVDVLRGVKSAILDRYGYEGIGGVGMVCGCGSCGESMGCDVAPLWETLFSETYPLGRPF